MKCNCDNWEKNIGIIDGALVKAGGYVGKQFVFCPWCGLRLMPVEVENGAMTAKLTRKHYFLNPLNHEGLK